MKLKRKLWNGFWAVLCFMIAFAFSAWAKDPFRFAMPDGEYAIDVQIEGGSGKAGIETPTLLTIKDQTATVRIVWSSSNYDYMIAEGQRFENLAEKNQNSVFEIPVFAVDEPMPVIADTTAMGTPHEIEYRLTVFGDSVMEKGNLPQEEAKKVLWIAVAMIVFGGILNHIVKKRLNA